ncbi:MAG TPA: hypothetical protein VFQ42_22095 [Mycobacterium sp.]|nr:hypothetical protein [Mycobacterium sp.]
MTLTVVTAEWRRAVVERLDDLGMSRSALARTIETSVTQVCGLLSGKSDRSAFVERINEVLRITTVDLDTAESRSPLALVPDPDIERIAELRAASDEIAADIQRLEAAQAAVADRLSEARQAHAEMQAEIRQRRARIHPTALDDARQLRERTDALRADAARAMEERG